MCLLKAVQKGEAPALARTTGLVPILTLLKSWIDREPLENATSVSGNIARIARSLMALIGC